MSSQPSFDVSAEFNRLSAAGPACVKATPTTVSSKDKYPDFPQELKYQRIWLVWKLEDRNGKLTKIPYDSKSGNSASSTDPTTWDSYEHAVSVAKDSFKKYDGIGCVIVPPYVGTDLDKCRDAKTGQAEPWALEAIKELNSYTELSPSDTGFHILTKGVLPAGGNRTGRVEMYAKGRYFTVSGKHVKGTPTTINERDLTEFHKKHVLKPLNSVGDKTKDTSLSAKEFGIVCGIWKRLGEQADENDVVLEFFTQAKTREKWEKNQSYVLRTIRKAKAKVYPQAEPLNNSAYSVPPAELPDEPEPEPVPHFHPKLSDDSLFGLAGDIVKKIMPQTESHPAGLLVQTLMYFGNIVGHTAYFQIESTRHYGNLFAIRVGVSSKARKGTGGDRINAVFEQVDPVWYSTRLRSGLSSSEGLIVAVGDQELDEDRNGHPVVINGEVRDKRLVSYEGEFSQLLVVMQRAGNTISTNIRNAWDGKPLRTLTIKPRLATNHTISIMGDITANEAKIKMTADDSANGFANRFLWVHVDRTKLLPLGGEEIDFGSSIDDLKKAIEFAQGQKRIFMDRNAREMWTRAYEHLSIAHDGLYGSVTSRSEAQVIRLALLYALLDCSDHIRSEHLHAALAFWQYCEDSARFIFDELTAEQQMMIEFLREHGSQTKTDLLKTLFQRHRPAAEIAADLAELVRRGIVSSCRNKKGVAVYFVQGRKDHVVLPEHGEA
jgi:hypothetical protein